MSRSKRSFLMRALAACAVVLAAAGTAAAPAFATFPGKNGRIAFDDFATGQIYTIDPDGSDLRQLTHGEAAAYYPNWSPDGTKIVFASNASGHSRLWIMNADGSNAHKLRSDAPDYNDFQPTYTPNGRRILFTRCGPDLPTGFVGCAIYSVRSDGLGRGPITHFQREVVDGSPSMSPNGRRIAFTRFNAHGIQAQIYLSREDGSRAHAVTPPELEGLAPDWSPGGKTFTFTSNCCRLGSRIYQWRPDGSQIIKLTDPAFPHNDFGSSYSPNGNRIAFASDRRAPDLATTDLYVMRADGAHLVRITTTLSGPENPSWGAATSTTTAAEGSPVITDSTVSPRTAAAALAARCALEPGSTLLSPCTSAGN